MTFLSAVLRVICPPEEDITPEFAQALAQAELHRDENLW